MGSDATGSVAGRGAGVSWRAAVAEERLHARRIVAGAQSGRYAVLTSG